MMKSPLVFLTAVLAGFATPGTAAPSGNSVEIELLTLSFNGSVGDLYYRSGDEVREMVASQQGIGAPFLYEGPPTVALYGDPAHLAPREEGDEPRPEPVMRLRLPAESDRALLVFAFKTADDAVPGVRIYGIDTGAMREGDYRVFNFSKKPVVGIFNGDKQVRLRPGDDARMASASWRDEIMDMKVQFGTPVDDKIRMVYGSVWGHRPERRMFVFVFGRDEEYRPLDIRMYFDVPAVKSAAVRSREEKRRESGDR